MRIRRVNPAKRVAYEEAVAATGVLAGEIEAHFWAFEADGGEGRFVEFLEGPEDEALARLDQQTSASLAVGGSLSVEGWPGTEGLRCTELRDSISGDTNEAVE
jgi:hypothetical protein